MSSSDCRYQDGTTIMVTSSVRNIATPQINIYELLWNILLYQFTNHLLKHVWYIKICKFKKHYDIQTPLFENIYSQLCLCPTRLPCSHPALMGLCSSLRGWDIAYFMFCTYKAVIKSESKMLQKTS